MQPNIRLERSKIFIRMKRHYDFKFTTLLMIQEFSDFGIYFRFIDDANYYVLAFRP